MRVKLKKEKVGMFKNPSIEMWVSEQGIPCTQGWALSGIIPMTNSSWYRAMSHPTLASATAYRTTPGSYGNRPRARMATSGYIAMR